MKTFFKNWLFLPTGSMPVSREAEKPERTKVRGGSYGERVTWVTHPDAALSVAAWHRALELRAKTMSQLVVQYQKLNREGGNFVEDDYGQAKQINYLLQVSPNPIMSAAVMWQQAELMKIQTGNAIIYIERDEYGWPSAFWLASLSGYNPTDNTYTINFNTDKGKVSKFEVNGADVLHVPNTFRQAGGYLGEPTLKYAAQVLSLAATNDREALSNASKGGKLKLIIGEEQRGSQGLLAGGLHDKKSLKSYADELNEELYNKDVIAIRGLDKVQPISMTAAEQELLGSRAFSVAEIARLTGVPKSMLMDDSNSSYKTPEAATQEFLMRTIQPMIREWENELDRKLLTPLDFKRHRFHVCEMPLLRLDLKTQAEISKTLFETGIKNLNELRSEFDLPAIEYGDIHYVSTNLAEVGSEKLRSIASEGNSEKGGEV